MSILAWRWHAFQPVMASDGYGIWPILSEALRVPLCIVSRNDRQTNNGRRVDKPIAFHSDIVDGETAFLCALSMSFCANVHFR